MPTDYDIPKIRDSLSTIEEEHQEYDIPRNIPVLNSKFQHLVEDDNDDPIGHNSQENLYENSSANKKSTRKSADSAGNTSQSSSEENIYANDSVISHRNNSATNNVFGEFSVSSNHTDDRSSGYRSSSSPSIQSEEIYVNESVIGSMEANGNLAASAASAFESPELNLKSFHHSKEIGVGTTGSLQRTSAAASASTTTSSSIGRKSHKKDKSKDKSETQREKERAQAEAVEKEILRKKEDQRPKSKAPKPPKTYFTESVNNKNNAKPGKIKTLFERKEEEPPRPKPAPEKKKNQVKTSFVEANNSSNSSQDKETKPTQKDRSVDVYHETVRQRATSRNGDASATTAKEVFQESNNSTLSKKSKGSISKKKQRAPQHPQNDINDDDLPSVKQLRSRFEHEESSDNPNPERQPSAAMISNNKDKSLKKSKIDFKKGYNVMFSLTRRSAMSVSKSMQNLTSSSSNSSFEAVDSKFSTNVGDNNKISGKNNIMNRKPLDDMEFDHITFGDEHLGKNNDTTEVKDEAQEALYVNIVPKQETAKRKKKKSIVNQQNDNVPPPPMEVKFDLNDQQYPYPPEEDVGGALYENLGNHGRPHDQDHAQDKSSQIQVQHRARNGGESSAAKKLLANFGDDEDEEEQLATGLGPWNPMKVLTSLYELHDIDPEIDEKHKKDDAIEGFLERLPPGKKKSTIWNSWKKQYFVAKGGLLLIFGDSSRSVLMDRIELFGGRVDFMESTMLGVQDRRGHYVVLRCKDGEEAERWHSALNSHVLHDVAQTYVTPSPRQPELFKQILVVDFGGASIRAGIVCSVPTLPQLFFPSVMAVGKGSHEDEKYFGLDAFAPEVRSRCNLSHPFSPSNSIDKLSVDQVSQNIRCVKTQFHINFVRFQIALQGFLEKIFKDLNVDPSHYEVQLVAPRPLNEKTQRQLASMLFDDFGVEAVNMGHQAILAMYAYNAHSGVVVDLGERMDVIPIVDGYRVSAGVSRSPVGGPQMRQKLQHYLLGRNYSLTTFVDNFAVRLALEQLSYLSRNFDRELERYRKRPEKIDSSIELGKKSHLEMGPERFEAVEGLFKPELWGLDQAGVHVLVHKAIRECSMDVRKEVTQSIFLSGGLSLIPGIRERIELELEKLSPATKPRVHASPYRYHASFIGATVHANSTAFNQTKLTKEEWLGAGQRLPHPWSLA